jgi:hypothetical protein
MVGASLFAFGAFVLGAVDGAADDAALFLGMIWWSRVLSCRVCRWLRARIYIYM